MLKSTVWIPSYLLFVSLNVPKGLYWLIEFQWKSHTHTHNLLRIKKRRKKKRNCSWTVGRSSLCALSTEPIMHFGSLRWHYAGISLKHAHARTHTISHERMHEMLFKHQTVLLFPELLVSIGNCYPGNRRDREEASEWAEEKGGGGGNEVGRMQPLIPEFCLSKGKL